MKVPSNGTIREVAAAIDKGLLGTAIVVDPDSDRFISVVTDGDIRRSLMNEFSGDSPVSALINEESITANINMTAEEINKLFTTAVRVIPILDNDDMVVDLAVFDKRMHLPVAEPYFDEKELKYVNDCVISGWVSSTGKYIKIFERQFADFIGSGHAVSCSNGTSALHLALKAFDIGPGDEVIVPALTFIATANSVTHSGATPVFVDSEPETWNMSPVLLEKLITSKTKAIIPVHLYGHPADMDPILQIARKHKLIVIEDAAEAHGALYKGKKVGGLGDAGVFSFFGNKVITTGEGGMVVINDEIISKKISLLRDHGMDRGTSYLHTILGFNYRMTNLQAALGVAQMEKIKRIIARKISIAENYNRLLRNLPGLTLPYEAPWARHIYWLYTALFDENITKIQRDDIIKELKENRIDARPAFIPMHKQPIYKHEGKYPVAESISCQGICLPSYVNIREEDQVRISNTIQEIISAY